MARHFRSAPLPPPYLRRVWFDAPDEVDWSVYPFNLPLLSGGEFEWNFDAPVTVIVGENGTGKSTLLEALAALAGFDEAGGGKGYRPVDHSRAVDKSGAALAGAMRAAWLPKLTSGWFFRAESFFSVARYLDVAALDAQQAPPDFLSHSHGEGFLRFFSERLRNRALYLLDEPESALSPRRQLEFLKVAGAAAQSTVQLVVATHSPLLMGWPGATLLRLEKDRLSPVRLEEIDHFRMMREFCADPVAFIAQAMED
jgi:predicted ATPase